MTSAELLMELRERYGGYVAHWLPDDWEAEGHMVGVGAALHLPTNQEPLQGILADETRRAEFTDFLRSLGYSWESGYPWSLHLYPLDAMPFEPTVAMTTKPCPKCKGSLDAKSRCWSLKCGYRLCAGCGGDTGNNLFQRCLPCEHRWRQEGGRDD